MIDLRCLCSMKLRSEKACPCPEALFIVMICEPELVFENGTWHVLTVSRPHWVSPHLRRMCFPVYIAEALGCSARNCLRLALGCMHFPGLSHSDSGTRVVLRGTDSVGPAFCALPRSEQLRKKQDIYFSFSDEVFGEHGCCDLSPPRRCIWVYNQRTFSGRC